MDYRRIGSIFLLLLALLLAADRPPVQVHAAPSHQQGTLVRFAVIGDYGTGNASAATVANLVKNWGPGFITTTGDNNYPDGAAATIDPNIGQFYYEFIGNYTGAYGPGPATNRFFPVLGNHDWHTTSGIPPLPQPYLAYFTLPGAGISSTNTSGNERYYDFIWGPIHFFMLDSWDAEEPCPCEPDGFSIDSVQYQWLETQLALSTAPWKLVYLHHPPYSSSTVHGSNPAMQWPYEAWGVTAVLAGHDHTYERVMRDDNSDTVEMAYIVNGLGGASRYSLPDSGFVAGSQVRYDDDYGAMVVEACATSITFNFYSLSDGLVDTYAIGEPASCAAPPPEAPTGLTATTSAGLQIDLSWLDNATNEIGFEIERSTSGSSGPFSLLATVGANTTTYTDIDLASETEYCYQVRATTSGSHSGYSNVACATTGTGPVTVIFQEGAGGYAGTVDTFIDAGEATLSHGDLHLLEWDNIPNLQFALIRFDNIFGPGLGQIPAGATIYAATLTYVIDDAGNESLVHEALVDWPEEVTYDTFGGDPGVQPDEYGSFVSPASGAPTGLRSVDVTANLVAWASDPSANHGWIFRPTGDDGVDVRSSDYDVIINRPRLTVAISSGNEGPAFIFLPIILR